MKTVEQYLNGQALVAELIAQTSPEPEVVKAFVSIAELLRQLAGAMDSSPVALCLEAGTETHLP
jgi:predicted dinucleotide-binding enzyme